MSTATTNRPKRRRLISVFGVLFALAVGLLLMALGRTAYLWRPRMQVGADIGQIENAVGLFVAKLNSTHVAATGGGPNGEFRLCTSYADADGNWLDWPEAKYLRQVFPRMDRCDNGLRWNGQPVGPESPRLLDVNQTLTFFLTGGPYTNYDGFSAHRERPFTPLEKPGELRMGPFLDFPSSRFDADGRVLDPWGTPFAYFTAIQGNDYTGSFTWKGATVRPYREPGNPTRFMNPNGFQVISAGRNGVFGPGGNWTPTWFDADVNKTPAAGEWVRGGSGADDLSNFNKGMLSSQR
jgi:hypothetical protein